MEPAKSAWAARKKKCTFRETPFHTAMKRAAMPVSILMRTRTRISAYTLQTNGLEQFLSRCENSHRRSSEIRPSLTDVGAAVPLRLRRQSHWRGSGVRGDETRLQLLRHPRRRLSTGRLLIASPRRLKSQPQCAALFAGDQLSVRL